jgi:hypothetical protein
VAVNILFHLEIRVISDPLQRLAIKIQLQSSEEPSTQGMKSVTRSS